MVMLLMLIGGIAGLLHLVPVLVGFGSEEPETQEVSVAGARDQEGWVEPTPEQALDPFWEAAVGTAIAALFVSISGSAFYAISFGLRCPKCKKWRALRDTGRYGRQKDRFFYTVDTLEYKCAYCGFKKWKKERDFGSVEPNWK